MHIVTKDNPFPSGLRGDKLHGAYYERMLNPDLSQYIVISPSPFSHQRFNEFMNKGLGTERINPNVAALGYIPSKDTLWLYKVMIFNVERIHHENQTIFSDNRKQYKEIIFDDIEKVLEFCKDEYNVMIGDFKKNWETNYPQW